MACSIRESPLFYSSKLRKTELNDFFHIREGFEPFDFTLIWMIVGLIFGFIIVGLFMVIAYIKFDDLIRAYQNAAKQSPSQ